MAGTHAEGSSTPLLREHAAQTLSGSKPKSSPGLAERMGLADQMGMYAAYHRTPGNKAMHFLGVPAITWGLMVLLAIPGPWIVAGLGITPAHLAVAAVLMYYLSLDFPFGVAAAALFTMLLTTAVQVASGATETAFYVGLGAFLGGWVLQLVGHGLWEKRRPALVDNVWQVFVAPLFLIAEVAFGMGLRSGLRQDVEEAMQAHLPAAPGPRPEQATA